jgi:glycosyltransferase involved in cell wall biosynthesis
MKQKIRVLECIRQGQIGGGESHLLSLVENLDKSQFDPVVLSFTSGPMIDRLTTMGIPVHIIPTTKPFDIRVWRRVKQLLKAEAIQLVHAHGTRANSNVLWAAKSLGIPVIYTIHGWSFHQDQHPFVQKVRIWGERYLTKRSDINIAVSHSNRQSGKNVLPNLDAIVINNGIDTNKFDPKATHANIRQELGISNDVKVILFLARFTSHKQPLTLLKAFAKALKKDSSLHLLMVGDGDQKQSAVKLIDELGLHEQVTLQPFRQDVPDVLASADIFVLPSLWEGLPIGLLEAMAMGKAVIASQVDGTSEIIRHNENGWLVSTDNLEVNLAKAIIVVAGDGKLRSQFEQQALHTVNQNFNAHHMTRQIENTYWQALDYRLKEQPAAMSM